MMTSTLQSLKRQKRFYELKLKKLLPNHSEYDETKKLYDKFKKEVEIYTPIKKRTPVNIKKSISKPNIPASRQAFHTIASKNLDIRIVTYMKDDIKGITLDANLFLHNLKDAQINCKLLKIDKKNYSRFLPSGTHFIFSEYILPEYANILLHNNRHVILVPNIDSYQQTTEKKFINFLLSLSRFPQFHIFCKTNQIYSWLKSFGFKNLVSIPFSNNIDKFLNVNSALKHYFDKSQKSERILLDTGGSTTKRKYFEEVVELFLENPTLPYHLIVKTVPNLFHRLRNLLKKYPAYSNITFISKIIDYENLNFIYNQCTYFLYLSKYDGYGLALSKAKRHGLFIFCLNGSPWNEILENYPKKKYISCTQDYQNRIGDKWGYAKSQFYYKVNFANVFNTLKEPISEELFDFDYKQDNKKSDDKLKKSLTKFFTVD